MEPPDMSLCPTRPIGLVWVASSIGDSFHAHVLWREWLQDSQNVHDGQKITKSEISLFSFRCPAATKIRVGMTLDTRPPAKEFLKFGPAECQLRFMEPHDDLGEKEVFLMRFRDNFRRQGDF
jgi:hypothetical protein